MITITSGTYKGRNIFKPDTDLTRPVSEQTRHAIFQVLGDIDELSVLDIFAGSGALGLEALSLGAKQCVFVDKSSKSINAITSSIKNLGLESKTTVVKSNAEDFLKKNNLKFDLVFLDPPYLDFKNELLIQISPHIVEKGIIVTSCSIKTRLPENITGINLVKLKKYGDTQIGFFRKEAV